MAKYEFGFTGSQQSWTAPFAGEVILTVYGAAGGTPHTNAPGGRGGRSTGKYTVKKGDVLTVYVGQRGYNNINESNAVPFNGGTRASSPTFNGGGGGATDIRAGGTGLANRIIVAGGGGGGAYYPSSYGLLNGGDGGGRFGDNGEGPQNSGGRGAYPTSGGVGGISPQGASYNGIPGTLGIGGNGKDYSHSAAGSGGGGGYYGGGGGAADYRDTAGGAGGGGSAYIGGVREGVTESGINDGHGSATIEYVNSPPTMPGAFTQPTGTLKGGSKINIAWAASTDADGNSITYFPEYRYYKNGVAQAWVALPNNASLSRSLTLTTDKTIEKIDFRVRAFDGMEYSDYRTSTVFNIIHNTNPTITLETENNKTLYEKDIYTIKGSALEPDIGDVLIVYYRINGGTARGIETKLSDGKSVPFSEQLTFKSGKLYKDETAITDTLRDGTPHTLEVWATDNQGGESEIETRTFYVVPNRPPSLTIDPIEYQSGLIDADKVTVTGESFDADGNDVVVRYRINNGINVEIHNGPAGEFSFDIPLSKLKDGENSIVVEVSDTFDFKASKTIKLNKSANLTPLSQSVQRYTIVPPAGSAQGVLLWIERDEEQEVTVEISMTNGTEPEQFVLMTLDSSGPPGAGIMEDFFKFRSDMSAEKIVIKLSWTGDKPIFKVSGALLQ